MSNLRTALFVCLICVCCTQVSLAQAIYGSTDLDIDPDTGTVTATCYTEADDYSAEYYQVKADCVVKDSNNNIVASGAASDDSGQGYVQLVVSFTGVPGETYTATSAHSVFEIYEVEYYNDGDPQPIFLGYDDMYDFGFYSDNPQTYDDYFEWDSPGPETATRSRLQRTGSTRAVRIRYYTLDELSEFITDAQNAFSSHCDTVFASVIVPTYTNANFFNQLRVTDILQFPAGAPNIPTHVFGADADTQTDVAGRPIRLFPNFFTLTSRSYQEFVIIHEGVHHYTGWDDPTVFTNFYSYGLRNLTGATSDFTDWIQNGCLSQ
jgi:hypothetical protein